MYENKIMWFANFVSNKLIVFFSFGVTVPNWALAYLHETPFHFGFLDLRQSVEPWAGDQLVARPQPVH
jgi:hypothetical protein